MLRARACLLLFSSACAAHTPGATASAPAAPTPVRPPACLLPAEASPDLIRRHGTALDAYQLEGGVWLEQAPVVLNEDFDFALAMGMEGGVGAGLAAAKRKENNARKASAFAALPASPELRARLQELRCCGLHVYFVLWGAESATLRTVIDSPGDTAHSRLLDGAARPLAGESAWTSDGMLLAEAQRSLANVTCPAPDAKR